MVFFGEFRMKICTFDHWHAVLAILSFIEMNQESQNRGTYYMSCIIELYSNELSTTTPTPLP